MGRISKDQIEERRVEVYKLFLQGKQQIEIAKELGVHRNTVTNDLRAMRKDKIRVPKELEEVMIEHLKLYEEFLSLARTCVSPSQKIAALKEAKELLLYRSGVVIEYNKAKGVKLLENERPPLGTE